MIFKFTLHFSQGQVMPHSVSWNAILSPGKRKWETRTVLPLSKGSVLLGEASFQTSPATDAGGSLSSNEVLQGTAGAPAPTPSSGRHQVFRPSSNTLPAFQLLEGEGTCVLPLSSRIRKCYTQLYLGFLREFLLRMAMQYLLDSQIWDQGTLFGLGSSEKRTLRRCPNIRQMGPRARASPGIDTTVCVMRGEAGLAGGPCVGHKHELRPQKARGGERGTLG